MSLTKSFIKNVFLCHVNANKQYPFVCILTHTKKQNTTNHITSVGVLFTLLIHPVDSSVQKCKYLERTEHQGELFL